jgi:hypothetical protein
VHTFTIIMLMGLDLIKEILPVAALLVLVVSGSIFFFASYHQEKTWTVYTDNNTLVASMHSESRMEVLAMGEIITALNGCLSGGQ